MCSSKDFGFEETGRSFSFRRNQARSMKISVLEKDTKWYDFVYGCAVAFRSYAVDLSNFSSCSLS